MFERCSAKSLDLRIVHSARACRIKIKKLKQNYKKIKDYNNKSGNDRKTSKSYDRLDALLGHRPSFSGTASTVDSGTMVWEAAQTADSVASDHDHDEGEAGQLSGLETSELSPPDRNSSACSSPFPPTKRKVLTRQMERQDEVSAQRHERQDELSERCQERQDELSERRQERQDERQTSFQNGFLEVLSQLVKANRSSSL
ncbi:Trihelix transcription factor GTL2 [Dissostichus eleginoides]|uniref:Trihelix transcription factor GTL2 n=1 Tax=Dissostichus eleginoides TaxID=100907 RepID=A0AAD9EXA1_DISEL|nr:Trihelix transcription factor GTL2 [Dissostichus eleginoides]